MLSRKSAIGSRSSFFSTPAFLALSYALSGMGSQPPKTRSSSVASGTSSLMSGFRFSVRLPSRMCASCVSDPIGSARPRRTASTPAIKVVATAPIPGKRMPNRPEAGSIFVPLIDSGSRYSKECSVERHAAPVLPNPHNALNCRQIGGDGENEDDGLESKPIPLPTEKERGCADQHHSLGAGHEADPTVQPKRLRAAPSIADH